MSTRIYSGSIQVNQHRKLKLLTRGRGSISLQLLFLSHEKRPQTYIFITLLPSRVCKIGVKILVSLTSLDPTFHLSNTHGTTPQSPKEEELTKGWELGMWKGQYVFLEVGVSLSPKPCLVITAVEQHVTITFRIERSVWTETLKNSKITMLPQLEILSHLTSYSYLLWNDWNRTGSSRLQPCDPGCQPYGKLSKQMFPPKTSILMNQHFN